MSELALTILMPCLNEEKTIGDCIKEAKNYIENKGISAEILVADNGSLDESINIARSLGARVIHVKKKGYGCALRAGIKAAKGEYIIFGDCDMSYNFGDLDDFLQKFSEGYELVVGNRFNKQMEKGAMPFSHKYFGVPFLSLLGRIKYHTKVKDFHCGLRGFKAELAKNMDFKSSGMEFATEIIGEFALIDAKTENIDIVFRKDHRDGASHLKTIPDGIRHLKYLSRRT